jgi:hypothetical protein
MMNKKLPKGYDICECGKIFKGNNCVWYSGNIETNLCRSCYMKWCKSKECKFVKEKYKTAKPCTKEWSKMCDALQKEFDKWCEKFAVLNKEMIEK